MSNTERYTVDQIKAALEQAGGIRLGAAQKLGCSPSTVKNYIDRYPELAEAEKEISDNLLDIAETELLKAIRNGNMTALIFFLKCKGKERGWTERKELTGPNGAPLADGLTIYELPDNGRG